MVLRANNQFSGIGGHLATYASAATLYEVGFNHFFRGKDGDGSGDQIFYQGHAAPGIYARAFLEGRLTRGPARPLPARDGAGRGPQLVPAPPPDARVLGVPDGLDGARARSAPSTRPATTATSTTAACSDTSDSRVWAFLGDGETDEPESLGALHVASREGLDNLTFVVNCNLQRLDGPVRGNGKIIQELESAFRGAGWNVIKVIWGREWDELLARDVDGLLVQQMNETLDGEFQKFSVAGGAYIREHFFGPDPRLRKLVEHLSDDDLAKLRRGGHDYRKVYAAYKAATEHKGAPTVILAHTVKGWTLGPGVEARNITHQAKKLSEAELKIFRDRLELPIPDDDAQGRAVLPPGSRVRGDPVPRRAPPAARRPAAAPDRPCRAAARPGRRGRRRVRRRQRDAGLDDDGLRPDPAQPDPRPGARPADRADHPGRGADLRHGPAVQGGRHLRRARPALRAGRLRPRPVVPRGDRRPGPRGGHHRGRLDGQLPGRRHVVRQPRPARRSRSTSSTRCSGSSGPATRCGRSATRGAAAS